MKIYIASDFHLKFKETIEDKQRREKVLAFLDNLKNKADILVLNGDIFDLWFAWNSVIIKGYFPILVKLDELRKTGCRLIFIAGNHDFWFSGFLAKQLQMEIYQDHFQENLNGINIYISHGDRYTTNDLRYKVFRTLIRNKFVMKMFAVFHPDLALWIGRKMSRSSRSKQVSPRLLQKREKGLLQFSQEKLKEVDLVIMGHSHLPKIEKMKYGIYANAGDWIINNSYIRIENKTIKLFNFKEEKCSEKL